LNTSGINWTQITEQLYINLKNISFVGKEIVLNLREEGIVIWSIRLPTEGQSQSQ